MTGGAVFSFGVPESRYFERWNPKYVFLDECTCSKCGLCAMICPTKEFNATNGDEMVIHILKNVSNVCNKIEENEQRKANNSRI